MDRSIKTIVALCATLTLSGCDSDKAKDTPAKAVAEKGEKSDGAKPAAPAKTGEKAAPAKPAKPPKKAEPEAPTEIVLEEVELEGLGKVMMPKGYKQGPVKTHWKYDLGDFKSINVSWEPHGAKSLKKAESTSKILGNAETVKTSKTLDSGFHEIERVRESDGYTFIAVFSDSKYIKCVAPGEKMEFCRTIVRSMK